MRLVRDDGVVVCARCVLADTPLRRLRGLLGRAGLRPGEGLLLRPTSSIHTCFMRFAIDAVFLDRGLQVLGVAADLRPWRLAMRRGARCVLELSAGAAGRSDLAEGDRLVLVET